MSFNGKKMKAVEKKSSNDKKVVKTKKEDDFSIWMELLKISKYCGIVFLYVFLIFFTKEIYTPMSERKCVICTYYLDYNARNLGISLIIGYTLFFLFRRILKKCKWLYYCIIVLLIVLTVFFVYRIYDITKFHF